jgi:hypothetical protein
MSDQFAAELPTLEPILALPETDNFAVVRTFTHRITDAEHGYFQIEHGFYGIEPKPCTAGRRTMIPLEQQQISKDIETVIKAMLMTERTYQRWAEQNGEAV